jgi:high-affinity nickel permease
MGLLTFSLLAVLIGMRHGMDGDHVAAIADLVGSEKHKRKQLSLGLMYAFGHGGVVLIIGFVSIFIGVEFSQAARQLMEAFVGLTLIILGGIILFSILQKKKDYEYKSRLKIIYDFFAKLLSKSGTAAKLEKTTIKLGVASAFVIGIIHGIGVESPTQLALFTNAAGLNNMKAATIQLILFVIGLLISTLCITFCLTWGFMKARIKRRVYLVLGLATGVYSLGLGVSMLAEFGRAVL